MGQLDKAMLRERIGLLSAARRQLLAQRVQQLQQRGGQPLHAQLSAYVTSDEAAILSSQELKAYVEQRLPDYMIPSSIAIIDELPRTSRGKLDRQALASLDPGPDDEPVESFVGPRNETERILADIWMRVLSLDQVGVHDNFFEVGGDSLLSIRILAKAHEAGLQIGADRFFDKPTIAGLARIAAASATVAEQEIVFGDAPLTPIQHWFFGRAPIDPHHWNESLVMVIPDGFEVPQLQKAALELLAHHDALRLCFRHTPQGWRQWFGELPDTFHVTGKDLSGLPDGQHAAEIASAATTLHGDFNLEEGTLLRMGRFELGPGKPPQLLIVVHHLACDMVSGQILCEDLESLYWQLKSNRRPKLRDKTTSWKSWSEKLLKHAQSANVRNELDYWLPPPSGSLPTFPFDCENLTERNTVGSYRSLTVALERQETRMLLEEATRGNRADVSEILLAALAQTLSTWSGNERVLVDIEDHAREPLFQDVDLSRTVGQFASIFPVQLTVPKGISARQAVNKTKQQLRSVPNRGIGYGLLRYLSANREDRERLASLPRPQVCFNYLGPIQPPFSDTSPFRVLRGHSGQPRNALGVRAYPLEVNAMLDDGRLSIVWGYSSNLHYSSTLESLANSFLDRLRAAIRVDPSEGALVSPSDFPLAQLDQAELENLSAIVDGIDTEED